MNKKQKGPLTVQNQNPENQSRAEILLEGGFTLWSQLMDTTGWKRDIKEVSLQLLIKLIIR